jgi:hypothetical protein
MRKLLFISMLMLSFQIIGHSQSDCFPPTNKGCTPIGLAFETVALPQYPNCQIDISYEIRRCIDENGVQEIEISNVTILSNILTCPDLTADLIDFIVDVFANGGSPQPFRDWVTDIFSGIQEEIADNIFIDLLQGVGEPTFERWFCDEDPVDDELTQTLTQVSFFDGSCTQTCFVGDGTNGLRPVNIICGTICCKKTISYCLNRGTDFEDVQDESNWNKDTVTVEPTEEMPCEETSAICPLGTIFSLSCSPSCGQ